MESNFTDPSMATGTEPASDPEAARAALASLAGATQRTEALPDQVRLLALACRIARADAALLCLLPASGAPVDELETLAVWNDGATTESFRYPIAGSPAEGADPDIPCWISDHVQDEFPQDHLLKDLGLRAYLAFPVRTPEGLPVARMIVLSQQPLHHERSLEDALLVTADWLGREWVRQEAEHRATASEQRLQVILDHAPHIAVQGVSRDGTIQLWNLASERLYGLSREDVLGAGVDRWLTDLDDRRKFNDRLAEVLVTGAIIEPEELSFRRPDGSKGTRWSSMVCVDHGTPTEQVLSVDVDLTGLRDLQAVLQDSERKLWMLMQSSGLDYWELHLPTNQVRLQRSDPQRGELSRVRVLSWEDSLNTLHPDDHAVANEALRRVVAGEASEYLSEHRVIQTEGGYRWKMARGVVVERDEQGEPVLIAGTRLDITERRDAEEALAASENRYYSLFQLAPEVLALQDYESGRFLDVNQAFLRLVGYDADDVVGHTPDELGLVRGLDHRGRVRQQLEQTGYADYDFFLTGRNGHRVEMEAHARLLVLEGCPCLLSLMHDVTDRRRAERRTRQQNQRLQALRSVDLALASSFDLRVTLGVILEQVRSVLGARSAEVSRLHPVTHDLELLVQSRTNPTAPVPRTVPRSGDAGAGRALAERRTVALGREDTGGPGFCVPMVSKGRVNGVLVVEGTPTESDDDWIPFLESLAAQAAIAIDNAALFEDLQRSSTETSLALEQVLEEWSRAEEVARTGGAPSGPAVARLAVVLAQSLGVPEERLVHLRRAAWLRDIGMSETLPHGGRTAAPLTEDERAALRRHPLVSAKQLRRIPALHAAAEVVLGHHERWDGTGYPHGLEGARVPVESRVLAVADAFTAMVSERPYRPARTPTQALVELQQASDRQFDPAVVRCLAQWVADDGPDEW